MRETSSMLPPIYVDAQARAVLPLCTERGRLGLALNMPDGVVARVALTPGDAEVLAGLLLAYARGASRVQLDGSSLSPNVDGSVPSEGQDV